MSDTHRGTARDAAAEVREALLWADEAAAIQIVTQFSYALQRAEAGELDGLVAEPGSTGDVRFDVLIAALVRYALGRRGITPPAWATVVGPLAIEWTPGYDERDVTPQLRELLRADSHPAFLEAGILARRRAFEVWGGGSPA